MKTVGLPTFQYLWEFLNLMAIIKYWRDLNTANQGGSKRVFLNALFGIYIISNILQGLTGDKCLILIIISM